MRLLYGLVIHLRVSQCNFGMTRFVPDPEVPGSRRVEKPGECIRKLVQELRLDLTRRRVISRARDSVRAGRDMLMSLSEAHHELEEGICSSALESARGFLMPLFFIKLEPDLR